MSPKWERVRNIMGFTLEMGPIEFYCFLKKPIGPKCLMMITD